MAISKNISVKSGKNISKKSKKRGFNSDVVKNKKKRTIPCDEGEEEMLSEVDDASDNELEVYERKPRFKKQENIRNLLPVKFKTGLVLRSEVIPDEEVKDDEDQIDVEQPEQKPEKKLTLVERYAIQQRVLDDLKCKVALLCTSVVEDPENNMPALKELITLLYNTKSQMVVTEKKILCVSLLHVFSDILPSYKIRTQEEKDPKVQLKKETKKLLFHESNLLRFYKKYIDYLHKLVQDMKVKKKSQVKLSKAKITAFQQVGLIAVKCLSELLSTRFSFNYFKNIAHTLVPLISEHNNEVSKVCCDAFERMFKADKLGEASFDLVRQIVSVIKMRKFSVPPCLLRSFLSLNLREAKPEVPKVDMRKGRQEWRNMSRKERWHKKKMKDLEAELKEAQAHESVETVHKFHMKTLNKIFWVFFHILKDGRKLSLLAPALEGLSKFAYLINLEFFSDLNTVLCELMASGKLSDVDKLHSVYTLFTILAGQAESLHIDPYSIYCHMYEGLLKLGHFTDTEHFILTLKCLDYNILRKRKKISFGRLLAFAKRVATVSLQTPVHGTLALLCCLRDILLNVKGSDILLDTESTVGSGVYFPEMKDPEHCNAQSTALWELHVLKKHYNPFVKLYSQYLFHGCPSQGKLALPEALAKSCPEDTLNLFADVAVYNKMDFLEETEEPPPKKFRHLESNEVSYENELDSDLSWNDLKNVDYFNCKN